MAPHILKNAFLHEEFHLQQRNSSQLKMLSSAIGLPECGFFCFELLLLLLPGS